MTSTASTKEVPGLVNIPVGHFIGEKEAPPRSCIKFLMVRIKTEVVMFLIVFDLLFQMQEKSHRSIGKKGRKIRSTRALRPFLLIDRRDVSCS